MFLTDITLGQAGLYALLGYAVVFFGLILLMLVVITIGKFFTAKTKQTQPVQDAQFPLHFSQPIGSSSCQIRHRPL